MSDDTDDIHDTDALDRALGRAWRDDYPWKFLTRLCEIEDRLGGHPGEREAAALVSQAFERAGMTPETETFPMQRWTRGHTNLDVRVPADPGHDGGIGDAGEIERSFEAVSLPYSPGGRIQGEIVDVGHGTPDEIERADLGGAVALADTDSPAGERHVHRMEKVGHAAAAGARAFVFHNQVPGQLPPTGALQFGSEAAIPGVGVSAETGAWLAEYADRGGRATLDVTANTESGESRNVVGTLGPDTEREIVVVAHHDAHDVAEGALDNGCGITVAVAAARMLAELDLDRRVRIAGVGCEEIGLLGSEALAASLAPDRVAAVVNLDGVGRFRDLRALTHTAEPIARAVERAGDVAGRSIETSDRPHPYSDHWPFLREGVPALQLHSRKPGSGGDFDRGWTHTAADTREKADERTLRDHAMCAALVIRDLAATDDLGRIDTDELRERLRAENAEPGMRAAGVWPAAWD